jgi:hypothetical protein
MWAMLTDGGRWAVPRCGLMYRKDERTATFALYERMPHHPDMPCTAEELREAQDDDHRGIVVMFAVIGVTVTDETSAKSAEMGEAGS